MEKQYLHQTAQAALQQRWEDEKTYSREMNPGPLYSIDTPPPTVSGSLHIGHIFSYTQTDIIARYKRMQGFSVFYPFGFDDNGLPTERFVEKKHNIAAHKLSRSEFINLCLQETQGVEKQFEDLWRHVGLSVDWKACYSTISAHTRKISQESFIRLYNKGFVYRKNEPALYCTTCRTSVSQAELDDKEIPSHFNDVAFTTPDGKELVIGTTRPELLPSCVALFYHPSDARYTGLQGTTALTPLFNVPVPVLSDEAVDPEKGTGLVMCCTFGDKTDIAWFKKYNLPFKQSVGLDGLWTQDTGILAGLKATPAREKMIAALRDAGLLRNQKPIVHAVNVHERCKKEIEYVQLTQWFINILEHKQTFIELADRINWYPSFMKTRYQHWVQNLNWDWGISRQRFFGIPFPAWHCKGCNIPVMARIEDLPLDPQEVAYKGTCPSCKGTNLVPDTDVMDTWNTSSLTPYLVQSLLHPEQQSPFEGPTIVPLSMRPQAHDIIRTWAFDTIVKVWMHHESIPWKDIVISGHVLSDAKEKISKSKGNTSLEPEQLLNNHSADVVRYWTASGSLGYDTPFSENQLKIGQRLVTKIWNAFRFIHEHTQTVPTTQPGSLGAVNEWMLHSISTAFSTYQHHLESHEFGPALDAVEKCFWHDFCDNYLELVKDQLFNPGNYPAASVDATRWTLHTIGLRFLQLYAPYLPYITDTLYETMYRKDSTASIHQTKFADVQRSYAFPESASALVLVIQVANTVRKLKTEKQLSLKVDLAMLTLYADQPSLNILRQQEQLLKGITRSQGIEYKTGTGEASSLVAPERPEDTAWQAHVVVVP